MELKFIVVPNEIAKSSAESLMMNLAELFKTFALKAEIFIDAGGHLVAIQGTLW